MSDVEKLVAVEIKRLAGRPQPAEVADMVRRVRRARRRSSILTAAAAALLIVVVSATALVLLRRDVPPPADVLPSGLVVTGSTRFDFVDPDHGFVLTCRCTGDAAETWLASTSDGGRTWRAHQVPALRWSEGYHLRVFDRDRAAIAPLTEGQGQIRFTADRGRTWQTYSASPDVSMGQMPSRAQAFLVQQPDPRPRIIMYLPEGPTAWLQNTPPEPVASSSGRVVEGSDGSLWIGGESAAYASRDRGGTWRKVEMPSPVGPAPELETLDGRHVYLVDRFGPNGWRVWRTTDDGVRWQEIPMPFAPASGTDAVAYAVPGGGLVIGDFRNGVEYHLAPAAESFDAARPGLAQAFRGGRYWRSGNDPYEGEPPFFHSADGREWVELRL